MFTLSVRAAKEIQTRDERNSASTKMPVEQIQLLAVVVMLRSNEKTLSLDNCFYVVVPANN